MAERQSRRHAPATQATLSSGTAQRIHRAVMRAVHFSYGAESALRNAVKLGTAEMFDAGASRPAVRHAIAQCVVAHPRPLPDRASLMTGESRASALLTRMLAWTDDVTSAPGAAIL
jgi:hypothetical protein